MKLPILLVSLVFYSTIECVPITRGDGLSLSIVHTNDMHARFDETNQYSAPCTETQSKEGKCYGGFARLATLIEEARKSSTPTLFLNGGDTYQGTIYYTKYKWRIVTKMMNLLAPDAISLGNHEFDDGVDGLIPFLNNTDFPVLTTNMDLSQEPKLKAAKNLKNSTILDVKGWKIAIIGYLTPDTASISNTEKVIFRDEVEAIREEVARIKAENEDVKIFIALGHSGFSMDKKIAEEVEDIDLVIGGHTNTFLFNERQPDIEVPSGLYPTVVKQPSGRKVYVVQAYAYTKYLGNLSIAFDGEGEIENIVGSPRLVDSSIPQDPKILEELQVWKKNISAMMSEQIGLTKVHLDGRAEQCRFHECSLGNLLTDALVYYNAKILTLKSGWTDAAISLHNAGTIRSSITRENNDKITEGDLVTAFPFANVLVSVEVNGSTILEMLEWGVHTMKLDMTNDPYGGFLQMSGIRVTYDLEKEPFHRVVEDKVVVLCTACDVPQYEPLEKDKIYKVLTTDFLTSGGDGFNMLKKFPVNSFGVTTPFVVSAYIKQHSPIFTGLEGRISWAHQSKDESLRMLQKNKQSGEASNSATMNNSQFAMFVLLLQILFYLRP